MKKLLKSKAAKHSYVAIGTGLLVFLGEAAKITTDPWVQAACAAGGVTLGALGIGYAKRSDP